MRRFVAVAAALSVGLVVPAAAGAYPTPSGLTPSASGAVCPPRPADNGSAVASPDLVSFSGLSIGASGAIGWSPSSGSNDAGGPAELFVFANVAASSRVTLQVQDSGGAWHPIGQWVTTDFGLSASVPALPPGPIRVQVQNNSAAAQSYSGELVAGNFSADGDELAQESADSCYRREQLATTQHADLGAITSAVNGLTANGTTLDTLKASLSTLDGDVKGLTANATTLDTLHADLGQLHTDNLALEAEMSGGGGTGGGGTTGGTVQVAGPVQLSSADRQLSADIGNQLDGTLWVLMGGLLGLFAMWEVLRFWRGRES